MKVSVQGADPVMQICPKAGKYMENKILFAHVLDLRYCHVCTICAMACPEDCIKIIRNAPEE